jgi:hypothetical protein
MQNAKTNCRNFELNFSVNSVPSVANPVFAVHGFVCGMVRSGPIQVRASWRVLPKS